MAALPVDLLIWRGPGQFGEVADPIPLAEWLEAADELQGFQRTDSFRFRNPFTSQELTASMPGSGVWVTHGSTVQITFLVGAVTAHRAGAAAIAPLTQTGVALKAEVVVAPTGFSRFTARKLKLATALRSALKFWPQGAELLLPEGALESQTDCLIVEGDPPTDRLAAAGFPNPAPEVQAIARSAELMQGPASDDLLVSALTHYLVHDAFIHERTGPGSSPSPARVFYDSLGPEREAVPCRAERCTRGAVSLSVLCRRHHFEMIRGIPCPFID